MFNLSEIGPQTQKLLSPKKRLTCHLRGVLVARFQISPEVINAFLILKNDQPGVVRARKSPVLTRKLFGSMFFSRFSPEKTLSATLTIWYWPLYASNRLIFRLLGQNVYLWAFYALETRSFYPVNYPQHLSPVTLRDFNPHPGLQWIWYCRRPRTPMYPHGKYHIFPFFSQIFFCRVRTPYFHNFFNQWNSASTRNSVPNASVQAPTPVKNHELSTSRNPQDGGDLLVWYCSRI